MGCAHPTLANSPAGKIRNCMFGVGKGVVIAEAVAHGGETLFKNYASYIESANVLGLMYHGYEARNVFVVSKTIVE